MKCPKCGSENIFYNTSYDGKDYYICGNCKTHYSLPTVAVSKTEPTTALDKAGYRKQIDTVKEFAEKIDLYLIKLFHQANDSQKECEQHNGTVWENGWQRKDERMIMIQSDIMPFIRQLAEQYGNEEE